MISSFRGDYRWLSNFWPVQIRCNGLCFPSVEHAYQAQKCKDSKQWKLFLSGTAGEAKALGRKVEIVPGWEDHKVDVMEDLLRLKFAPGTSLAAKLLATGDEELVEGNHWRDTFWGQCPVGNGENMLGKLLMKIRSELAIEKPGDE